MSRMIFVTGGTRSGKSAFAEEVTAALGSKVTYIATARAGDGEMAERIALHRRRRPDNWQTVEEPEQLKASVEYWGERSDVIMIDCLTLYLSNLLLADETDNFIGQAAEEVAAAAKAVKANVVVVSNETGLSLVPPNKLGRRFQEIVGRANQVFAQAADEAYLVVAGMPLEIKETGREIRARFRKELRRED